METNKQKEERKELFGYVFPSCFIFISALTEKAQRMLQKVMSSWLFWNYSFKVMTYTCQLDFMERPFRIYLQKQCYNIHLPVALH